MSLFIREAIGSEPLQEDVIDAIADKMDEFITQAERKLKGYSVKEVDRLARAAKSVNTEVKKRETLEKIETALTDARKALASTKNTDKSRELRLQIQVLGELKTKVNAFKVAEHKESEPEHKGEKEHKDVINLDER